MALPQGIRLTQELGSGKVYAAGPGGKWWIPNPKEAARLFGNDWAQQIEKVRPGSIDNLKDFGTFDEAMRAPATDTGYGAQGGQQVGGGLNMGGAPNPQGQDFGYGQSYQNYLQLAQQTYQNVLSGYQNTLQQQQQRAGQIQQGYGQLGQQVQDTLQGAEAGQRQRIGDIYAQQQANAQQGLINSGLANTTAGIGIGRGIAADQAKAEQDLSGQFAQMRAGYQQQIGQAGLGFAQQALGADTDLYGKQLSWMDSFRQPQPDALGYGQLGQQRQQFGQNLAFQQSQDPLARLQAQQQSQHPPVYSAFGAGWGG